MDTSWADTLTTDWVWAMGCKYKWCISLLDQSIQKLVNILSGFCVSPCWSTTFPVTQLEKEFIGTQREIFVALCLWNFKPNFFSQHSLTHHDWHNVFVPVLNKNGHLTYVIVVEFLGTPWGPECWTLKSPLWKRKEQEETIWVAVFGDLGRTFSNQGPDCRCLLLWQWPCQILWFISGLLGWNASLEEKLHIVNSSA